ncbi:4-aminobutyrate--2-oxoglutarate transaminase [Salinicoccus halitifaciens]|uniref:(S)-3-amino-2-methylpropionate transaminase n=1 Tax=Salinicoccus halitifaciens TaxID=1073415 RepID=A0ABV2E8U6_9STAP|nr:4-aminobutyrate--2-oxoglutarate transaminase [Salinicoccus halitifaciens]MCD2137858.1 4-aminobutyrate--2-oxoglutarate transaminase [Salinicoccus halitifaciens]
MNRTQELQKKREQFVSQSISNGNKSIAAHAKGATITDPEGNEVIDFGGAIGVLNVGHSHSKVTEAVKNQVEKFLHPGFNCIMYESYIELAEKLCGLTPGDFDKKAAFFNSGAEGVENAVKMARKYTGRSAIVSFKGGFHGRTNLTMSMTSKVKPYKNGFGPFASDIYHAPYPNVYRRHPSLTEQEYTEMIIEDFHKFFIETVAPENVACVVIEPVQGEAGFLIPPKSFMNAVAKFCKENGIVFIADEIQTGFGRTGKLFASEHFGIEPDLMVVSKSLSAGLPLSGVVGKSEILDSAATGEIGGTFAGNPVACAAGLAVLDVIEEEDLCNKAEKIGQSLEDVLKTYQEHYSFIGEIRRLGAMVAVEIVKDDEKNTPDKEIKSKITNYANENGLVLLSAGVFDNVIRFLIPLVITNEELEKGLEVLEKAFKNVESVYSQ